MSLVSVMDCVFGFCEGLCPWALVLVLVLVLAPTPPGVSLPDGAKQLA